MLHSLLINTFSPTQLQYPITVNKNNTYNTFKFQLEHMIKLFDLFGQYRCKLFSQNEKSSKHIQASLLLKTYEHKKSIKK